MATCGGLEISQEHGLGEPSMMTFIHEHLNSILEPFIEHVHELHGVVNDLVASVEAMSPHDRQLAEHGKLLHVAQAEAKATKQKLSALAAEQTQEAATLSEGLARAAAAAEEQRSELERVDREQREGRGLVWDVQQGQKALEVEIRRVREAIPEDTVPEHIEQGLAELRMEVQKLSRRHTEVLESNSKFQERLERQADHWSCFLEKYGLQRREEELRLKELRQELSTLRGGQERAVSEARRQTSALRSTQEELSVLVRRQEHTMRQQAVQERQQLEARERHEVLVERLERLRADTTNVLESLGLSEGAANLVHTVQGLVEAKEELDLRVEKLEEEGEVRGNEIGKLQRRADHVEVDVESLKEQNQEMESMLLKRIAELQDTFCHSEQRDAEEFRQEVASREEGDAKCLAKLKAQEEETLRLQEQIGHLGSGIDSCGEHLRALEQKVGSTQDQVSNLCGTVDLTQEYWKGLTRGIQETHRKVALTERLPLKSPRPAGEGQPQRGTLPALTKAVGADP